MCITKEPNSRALIVHVTVCTGVLIKMRVFGIPNQIPMNVTIYGVDQANKILLIEIIAEEQTSSAVTVGTTTPMSMHTTGSLPTPPSTMSTPTLPSQATPSAPKQCQTTSPAMKLLEWPYILFAKCFVFIMLLPDIHSSFLTKRR